MPRPSSTVRACARCCSARSSTKRRDPAATDVVVVDHVVVDDERSVEQLQRRAHLGRCPGGLPAEGVVDGDQEGRAEALAPFRRGAERLPEERVVRVDRGRPAAPVVEDPRECLVRARAAHSVPPHSTVPR